MKKVLFLLLLIVGSQLNSFSQYGYITSAIGSAFDKIDLTDATVTNVGTGYYTASDFGPNGVLYAIDDSDNSLYTVDTITGATTLIGTMSPPANHVWVGMAYDESSSTMYAMSCYGIAAGESSLHTVDLSNATYTLVGTQSTVTAFGCIAINDDNGQMYGMSLTASASIYEIDKTDGSVTIIGPTGQGAAGMGHGMDYCQANSTMYLTTYDSFTFNNTINTVDLTTGAITAIGFLNGWTSTIAIPGILSANFSSDVTEVCVGGTVNFINQSTSATSYNWTFEGGTPATSTDENPSVVYNTPGTYDVSLTASNSGSSDTFTVTDMITVNDTPGQADTPTGETTACSGSQIEYSTNEVLYADSYIWEVNPATAGNITDNSNTVVFYSSNTYTGDYTIKVQATNSCGTGIWSGELACTLNESPNEYSLSEGGDACEGGDGVEITLSGSDTGVDYYLHHNGDTVAGPIAGTGDALSFGFFNDGGYYSATAYNGICNVFMIGDAIITLESLPTIAETPDGPESVCTEETSDYTVTEVEGAISYVWTISPEEAGTIEGETTEATVTWNSDYEGIAEIAARGQNDCGAGPSGPSLEVMVYSVPNPEISGDQLVCKLDNGVYTVDFSEYSTYTWTVDGGTIVDGDGTNEITVYWTADQGSTTYVDVTESKTDGCETVAETFEVTIDDCVGIDENFADNVEIYPNPANKILNINIQNSNYESFVLKLTNIQGKEIYKNMVNTNSPNYSDKISLEDYPEGLYLFTVTSKGITLFTKKIILKK